MTLELDKYRHCVEPLRTVLEKEKDNLDFVISRFASLYGIPVLAVFIFAEEILGKQEFIDDQKEKLIQYYGYEKII